MRVVVAGATGTVGLELTRQLIAAGHEVIGITRGTGGAEKLRGAGAGALVADVLDRKALLAGLDGERADAVIHQATAITRAPTAHRHLYATDRLRTEGTENLLAAADRVGASRFVTQSFLHGYGYRDHGAAPVTEEAPFGGAGRGGFAHHLRAMRTNEDLVLGASGITGTALRYGVFYGHEPGTLGLFDQAERRRLVAPRRGGLISLIHVEDAASAAVAALERGGAGRAFNIADDRPHTWTSYLEAVAAAAGARPPWRVPNSLLLLSPYLGTELVRSSLVLDNSRAERELGWRPRHASAEQGLAAVAAQRGADRIVPGSPER